MQQPLQLQLYNTIGAQLIAEGFVKFKPNAEFIFSPGNEGIIMMALFWAIGLWMMRKQSGDSAITKHDL
jgi:hypothetical protein